MFMVPATVIAIMMKCFMCPNSNILVLWVIFVVYILYLISRTFVVSAIFSNSFMAMIVLCSLNLVSFMPFFMSFGMHPSIGKSVGTAMCINSAMSLIIYQILRFEIIDQGVQWDNMFRCAHPEDVLSYGSIMLIMIFSSLICLVLCLYLDQLRPGGFRAPKKWNFPFNRQFYCPSRQSEGNPNEDEQATSSFRNQNTLAFEEVDNGNAVIIDCQNLSKTFGPKLAVRNFSLKLYENELTVLLGHNGAGKTAILMMMAGLYTPTSGRVLINGNDMAVSPQRARKNICICSQQNIFFEELSAFWHIYFYSRLKGLSSYNAEQEAYSYLYKINLKHKARTKVRNLSIDMRRKLSLCCALCAGTKVILVDDPSANLDPSACRDVWDLLRTEKEGRCILVNTYSVNAAEVLGDRIGIISAGELIGYGTSDFLINNLGPGYRLVCVQLPNCREASVTTYLQSKMGDVRLEGILGSDIVYRLPVAKISKYSRLFRSLEKKLDALKLVSFGVGAPTMDETFSKIGADKVDQSQAVRAGTSDEWVQQGIKIQETSKKQRCLNEWHGMLIKKMLYTRHNLILLVCLIILPMIVAVLNLMFDLLDKGETTEIQSFSNLAVYPNPTVVRDIQRTYHETNASEILDDRSLESAAEYDKAVMLAGATMLGIRDGVEEYLLDKIELNEEGFTKTFVAAATFRQGSVTAWYNRRLTHGQPTTLSLIYKAIGSVLASVDIEITNKPRASSDLVLRARDLNISDKKYAAFIMVYLGIAMATYIILPIQERISQMTQQQFLSGISLYTYWLSHLLWDYLIFLILALSLMIAFYQKPPAVLYWLLVNLLAFAFAALPFIYLFSFAFKVPYIGLTIMVFFNTVTAILSIMTYYHRSHRKYYILHRIFLFEPFYAMYSAALLTLENGNMERFRNSLNAEDCQKGSSMFVAYTEFICMIISGIIFFSLVLLISKFHHLTKNRESNCPSVLNDEDVMEARKQVDEIVKQQDLLKSYGLVCDRVSKKFKDLTSVNCVSFKISPHNCFGLLGISGAGKTCTIDLIVGNSKLSQGNIYVKGFSMKKQRKKCFGHMGYCPQQNTVLMHYMTGREMLKFACLIRGIKKEYISGIIENLAESFVFTKSLDQMMVHYSNGIKRKLSIAIAVLSPTLICLDDPITDVDISAKQEIAKVLTQMRSYGKSILITSHNVADCEILCSSLAFMVKGKLRCIGTAEDIKTRFNRGISIKIQLGTIEEMDEIKTALINLSSGPSNRSSDNKGQRQSTETKSDFDDVSPTEKAVQVKIKRKNKKSLALSPKESLQQDTVESSGRGTLVIKRRKTSVTGKRTTIGVSHIGSSVLNVYVTSNDEFNYSGLLMDVERKFKADFPKSYVSESFTYRGLLTIVIPNKDLKWSEIFRYMEDNRFRLQIKHYSISQTTLEDIFLSIVQSRDSII
ncbi:ATP-binding cassette sub-family A member 2 [Drosophila innubila]|uniref:ATP-binding cassette sub-family A member 2 n=1 Tax=Drosophila innubila TaxID=198719 RepID=UPI00148CACF9|nr:ATP-binding cassette sub-family A member 2 [Drosophila innubila]